MNAVRQRTSVNGESATRRAVRAMLLQGEAGHPMTVREMATALQITPQAVRKHLAAIRKETS